MNIETVNEIAFKFGDYAIIEQKRHGVPNEMFVHKVVDQLSSNSWVDVPVQSPATETLHDEMEDVCWCICCGVNETEVRKYRVKDMQSSSLSPDGSELTAALATIEKCRELTNCPAGVDLQDWVKQLAAENAELKSSRAVLAENTLESCNSIACAGFRHEAIMRGLCASTGNGNKYPKPITTLVDEAMRKLETPATDRIVAGIKADGVEEFIGLLQQHVDEGDFVGDEVAVIVGAIDCGKEFFEQLREGAK